MPMLQFGLDTLRELDNGKAAIAFDRHVKRASTDCLDRPGDPKPRTVTLEIQLTPRIDPDSLDCTEVECRILASSKVPPHHTKALSFGLRKNGILVFNPDSPDAVDQKTLLNDEE